MFSLPSLGRPALYAAGCCCRQPGVSHSVIRICHDIELNGQYSPTPPPSARRPTGPSSAAGSVFSAALSKVVKRGPLEEDDELASAKAALEKLEVTWAGAAAGINAVGKARRSEYTSTLWCFEQMALRGCKVAEGGRWWLSGDRELTRIAYAAASQEVGGKLISLSTVESDFGLQGAERKVGRALETVAGVHGAQVCRRPIP